MRSMRLGNRCLDALALVLFAMMGEKSLCDARLLCIAQPDRTKKSNRWSSTIKQGGARLSANAPPKPIPEIDD